MEGSDKDEQLYREKAKRELDRRIAEYEAMLLGNGTDGDKPASDVAATRDTAAAGKELPTDSAETIAFLRSIGMSEHDAKWFAAQYPAVMRDAAARRAFSGAARYMAGTRAATAIRNSELHKGHRERLRTSAMFDIKLDSFSDIEIVEMMLAFFTPRRDTNPLAHRLLDKYGSLIGIFRAPTSELKKFPQMTKAAAELFPLLSVICMWNGRRDVFIRTTADAVNLFMAMFDNNEKSNMYIAFLDSNFAIISIEMPNGKDCFDPKPIVGSMYKYSAAYVIIAKRAEAKSDLEAGERVRAVYDVLKYLGSPLLDCIMFSEHGYYTLPYTHEADPNKFLFVPYAADVRSPRIIEARNAKHLDKNT